MRHLSDSQITSLWKNPKFPANHSGIQTFRAGLLIHENVKVSTRRVRRILHSIPEFLEHSADTRKATEHRHLHFPLSRNLQWQCDLLFLPEDINPKKEVFLLCVDLCSLYLFLGVCASKKQEGKKQRLLKRSSSSFSSLEILVAVALFRTL